MPPSQTSDPSLAHRRRRRLLVVSVVAVSFVLIALLMALLVRNLTPRARPVLRLTPAAAAVDEQTTLLLSGSGWRRGEEVAICAASSGDSVCDAKSALRVIEADRQGAIEVEVLAGPLLGQGLTTFIASGIESGQVASRSFRTLTAADDTSVSALAPTTEATTPGSMELARATVDPQSVVQGDAGRETLTPFADWRGEYFANPDFSGEPALVRNDGAVDFDWGEASPVPGVIPADAFSARWTRLLPFAEGTYRFSITSNDGARVLVDNQVLVEAWNGSSDQAISADTQLSQGNHEIIVLFYDNAGPARVVVGWSPIQVATPTGVAVVPSLSTTPTLSGEPVTSPTPTVPPGSTATWTPTVPPGSTATWTPTVPPGSTATWTPTVPPGSTPTWTPTVPPGSTATPTPTVTPTIPPGSTATPTPTVTPTGAAFRDVGLNQISGPVGTVVTVSISGAWTPGISVFVTLFPPGAAIPPVQGQFVPTEGSAVTSSNQTAVTTQFVVPNNSLLLGYLQPIRVVVHTGNWNEWSEADTGFTIE